MGIENDPKISTSNATMFSILAIAFSLFVLLFAFGNETLVEEPEIKFEKYVWRNLSPNTLEPVVDNDDAYQPLALKVSDNIEKQTGIQLEKIVEQGGEVIFNFFYTDTSPVTSGRCDLIEVIIATSEGKIIEDYILRYTDNEVVFNQKP